MGTVLVIILIFLALPVWVLIYWLGITRNRYLNKKKVYDQIGRATLDGSFTTLGATQREYGLNKYWYGWEKVRSALEKVSTSLIRFNGVICVVVALIYLLLLYLQIDSMVTVHDPDSDHRFSLFWIWSGANLIVFSLSSYGLFTLAGQMENLDDKLNSAIERIQSSVANYVNNNLVGWVKQVESKALGIVTDVSASDPDQTIVFYDQDIQSLDAANKLPPTLDLSICLIGQHLTIVSNIRFDLRKSTYSLVQSDTIEPRVTPSNEWQYDEIYFENVVELTYVLDQPKNDPESGTTWPVANGSAGRSVTSSQWSDTSDNASTTKQVGYLKISLENGSNKFYPCNREAGSMLIQEIRKNVRNTKLGGPSTQARQSDTAPSNEGGNNFCSNCGQAVKANSHFCSNCGHPI